MYSHNEKLRQEKLIELLTKKVTHLEARLITIAEENTRLKRILDDELDYRPDS